ncbi:type II secretion system F family protein [Ramlibacter sp. G-1-2-2]|uniref:Type II secretion system F family protein n=1 Tax=Ramlibacter agri TaxID=2728837 RepID=A0A848H4M4_9BURK|nr:type II secretion system F family protein [Ramlibacter agri]NML44481.1 type II secretion system F family protein [Ramlibacter agri]
MAITFELVVRSAAGAIQTLAFSAADAADARSHAVRDGFQVLACTPRASISRRHARNSAQARRGLDITTFSYELASLLSAGLSVLEALRTLAAKEGVAARRAMVLDLIQDVGEGLPLSGALAKHPGRYPPLMIATVSASEQTGDLGLSLRRYAEHQQSVRTLRDKVVGATIYPALLLGIGLLVVALLLGVVVPKFAVLIESTRKELPWTSQLMMSWGRFAAAHAWELGAGALVLAIAVVSTVRRVLRDGAKARWIDALPFVGSTVRKFRHAQLYRTTGMLVRGGIPAPRALKLSSSLLGDADAARLDTALRMIQEGRGLSSALNDAGFADPVAGSMLAVAERTGALAEILERIAQFNESSLQRSVELTSRLFEPILMIVIGLVIGAIVVLMYLPIFDLASSLQ